MWSLLTLQEVSLVTVKYWVKVLTPRVLITAPGAWGVVPQVEVQVPHIVSTNLGEEGSTNDF